MTALHAATAATTPRIRTAARMPMVRVLRTLLIGEAVLGLGLTVFLSLLAAALRDFLGGESGLGAEQMLRFAAGGTVLFAIAAAISARGVRGRRPWAWTLAALLQLVLAFASGVAVLIAPWHPTILVGFVGAAAVMLVLSTSPVRRALGQE